MRLRRHLAIIGFVTALVGCTPDQLNHPSDSVTGQQQPTEAASDTESSNWQTVEPGLDYRKVRLSLDLHAGTFTILRIDPNSYRIRVAYDRASPGTIQEWATAVKPVALINGGYFDENRRATALVIFDGIAQGTSYEGFGGMVVVNAEGKFELRSLRQQPYDPAEPLQQAMQSSPMLIQPGGTISDLQADAERSRRTVIGRDNQGRILLMVNDWPAFTLPELAQVLKNSDLDLDAALNLDGGRSTGMYLKTGQKQVLIEAYDQLPLVLVVDKP